MECTEEMYSIKEVNAGTLVEWLQEDKDFRLLDIRSVGEFAQGMIPRGEQLPMHVLPIRMSELEKEAEIVLYCRSGARSAQACMYLQQQGYDNVYNLSGGIISWAREGFPLVEPSEAVA